VIVTHACLSGISGLGCTWMKKFSEDLEGCTKPEEFLSVTYWLELYRHVHKFIFACFITLYIVVSKWREPSALNRAACLVAASYTMPGKHQPS
jgi:hypothetical protein